MVAQINTRNSRTSERVPVNPERAAMAERKWARSGKSDRGAAKVPRRADQSYERVTTPTTPERSSVNAVLLHLEVQGLLVGAKAWRTRRIAREPESPGA